MIIFLFRSWRNAYMTLAHTLARADAECRHLALWRGRRTCAIDEFRGEIESACSARSYIHQTEVKKRCAGSPSGESSLGPRIVVLCDAVEATSVLRQ